METDPLHILLADDSKSDRTLFKIALDEIPVSAELATVNDGEQLMHLLTNGIPKLPDVLFLDLNMPRKSGYECLAEIKQIEKLKPLPVVVFSTSFNKKEVHTLYENGAHYYIQKPSDFATLVTLIQNVLIFLLKPGWTQPPEEDFVLHHI